MALPIILNTKTNVTFTPTLAGAPGQLDATSPFEVALTPATNGTVENVVLAADGKSATLDVTITVAGDTAIATTKADGNLAAGVTDVIVTDTLQAVVSLTPGADGGTFTVTPPVV
jgi:hypothetical protein